MANVSKYLQPPGTQQIDVHEQSLSRSDLKQTIAEENSKAWICTLFSALGIGVSAGDVILTSLIHSSWSTEEQVVRWGVAAVSLIGAFIEINRCDAPLDHTRRALELLSGEIGERPAQNSSAAPANNLQ